MQSDGSRHIATHDGSCELRKLRELFPNVDADQLFKLFVENKFNFDSTVESALTATVSPLSQKENLHCFHSNTSHRGYITLLPDTFLVAPRMKFEITVDTASYLKYSVTFSRLPNEEIGIKLGYNRNCITVNSFDMKKNNLVVEAGVKIGDFIMGINSDNFCPGVELQDVQDLLQKISDQFITLHFIRFKTSIPNQIYAVFGVDHFTNCKFTQTLLDQDILTLSAAGIINALVYRMKQRIVQWDPVEIDERISKWNLCNFKRLKLAKKSSSLRFSSPNINSSSCQSLTSNSSRLTMMSDSRLTFVSDNSEDHSSYSCLRPALSVQVLHAEDCSDHTVYRVWAMDVSSGVEWSTLKRYSEFHEFRQTLISIRPCLSKLDFPSKTFSSQSAATIAKRLHLFQRFLRRICNTICFNSTHPSTIQLQLALQEFIGVQELIDDIELAETVSMKIRQRAQNSVQCFVHNVVHFQTLDKVFAGYIDGFYRMCSDSTSSWKTRVWSEEKGRELLQGLASYIDNLQTVLCEALEDECREIALKAIRKCEVGSQFTSAVDEIPSIVFATEPTEEVISPLPVANNLIKNAFDNTEEIPHTNCLTDAHSQNIPDINLQNKCEAPTTSTTVRTRAFTYLLPILFPNMSDEFSDGVQPARESEPVERIQSDDSTFQSHLGTPTDSPSQTLVHSDSADSSSDKETDHLAALLASQLENIDSFSEASVTSPRLQGQTIGNNQSVCNPSHTKISSYARQMSKAIDNEHGLNHFSRQIQMFRATIEDEIPQIISAAVRKQVETEIYVPCMLALRGIMKASYRSTEQVLQSKIQSIINRSEEFFGVAPENVSPSGWSEAIASLSKIRSQILPVDKLTTLVSTCKLIPVIFEKEHPSMQSKSLGADEFLPIFVYVLIKSNIQELISLQAELQILCDQDQKLSESGYYLASLEASIEFITISDVTNRSLFPFSKYAKEEFSDSDEDTEEGGSRSASELFEASLSVALVEDCHSNSAEDTER